MKKHSVIPFEKPVTFVNDSLTEIIRNGARKLLEFAIEEEIDEFLTQFKNLCSVWNFRESISILQ